MNSDEILEFTFYLRRFPNNKVYIGCTSRTPEERAGRDGIQYRPQPVYQAIQEFGWESIETIILEKRKCSNTVASEIEAAYIAEYHSNNPEFGYNCEKSSRYNNSKFKLSDSAKKKLGESKKGRIWCHKGDYTRFVTEDDWDQLKTEGYVLGESEKTKEKRLAAIRSLVSMRSPEGVVKHVKPDSVGRLLSQGWMYKEDWEKKKKQKHLSEVLERRKTRIRPKTRWVYFEEKYHLVPEDKAMELVDGGFAVFDGPKHDDASRKRIGDSSRNTRCVNNGVVNRFIKIEQVPDYLDQGWKLGRIKKN